jgi:hypothetical protein
MIALSIAQLIQTKMLRCVQIIARQALLAETIFVQRIALLNQVIKIKLAHYIAQNKMS